MFTMFLIRIFLLIAFTTSVCFSDVFYHLPEVPIPKPTIICPKFDRKNVKFYLHTRRHPSPVTWISNCPIRVKDTTYDKTKETKIIVHGWLQQAVNFSAPIKDAYLKMLDVNVIVVDYDYYSTCEWFHVINHVAPEVGATIANMVEQLRNYGTSLDLIHIIGHSLGSHVVGYAGKNIPDLVGRITGVDPAGGNFDIAPESKRLAPSDARFVDVISTNAGALGINKKCGHANFYVNSGILQFMCNPLDALCNHQISVIYFVESILYPDRYCSQKCDNFMKYELNLCAHNEVQHMGEYVYRNASGKYYLQTNSREPFGKPC